MKKSTQLAVSYSGLVVFVLGVAAAVGILIWDGELAFSGNVTVTEWATAHPWRAVLISVATLFVAAGLPIHFYFWPRSEDSRAR